MFVIFAVGRLCCRDLQNACCLGFSFQSSVSFLTLVFLVAQLFVIVRLLWHRQLSPSACVCYGMLPVGSCSCVFAATYLSVGFVNYHLCVFVVPVCSSAVSGCEFVFVLM